MFASDSPQNGLPDGMQELYEALWDDLYEALKKRGQAIAGIWISDVAHQGASGLLNEDKLGNDRKSRNSH